MQRQSPKSLIGCGYEDSHLLVPGISASLARPLSAKLRATDARLSSKSSSPLSRIGRRSSLELLRDKGISQSRQLVSRGQSQTAIQAVTHKLLQGSHSATTSSVTTLLDDSKQPEVLPTAVSTHEPQHEIDLLMERAKLQFNVGQYANAVHSIERVLDIVPRHPAAWALKAMCFENAPLLRHRAKEARRVANSLLPSALQRKVAAAALHEAQTANRIRVVPLEQQKQSGLRKHKTPVQWSVVNRVNISRDLRGSWVSGERLRKLSLSSSGSNDESFDRRQANDNPFYRAVAAITARGPGSSATRPGQGSTFRSELQKLEESASAKRVEARAISSQVGTMQQKVAMLVTKGRERTARHLRAQVSEKEELMQKLTTEATKLEEMVEAQRRKNRRSVAPQPQQQALHTKLDEVNSNSTTVSPQPFTPDCPAAPRGSGGTSRRSKSGRRLPRITGPTPEELEARRLDEEARKRRREEAAKAQKERERRQRLEQFEFVQMSKLKLEGNMISQEQFDHYLDVLDILTRWGCSAHRVGDDATTTAEGSSVGTSDHSVSQCSLCQESPFLHAQKEVQQDEQIFHYLLDQKFGGAAMCLRYVQGSELCNDFSIALKALALDPSSFQFLSPKLRDTFKLAMMAVKSDWQLVQYASERLRGQDAVMTEAIRQDVQALRFATLEYGNHRAILDAVTEDGSLLEFCNLQMRSKRDIALAAVVSRQEAALFFPPHLKNDPELFGKAVEAHGAAVLHGAGKLLLRQKDFIFTAVKRDPMALAFADASIMDNPRVLMEAVEVNGMALKYAPKALCGHPLIAFAAVKQNPFAMEFVDLKLRSDKNFVKQCLQVKKYVTGHILKFASPELRDCEEIVCEAVKANGMALQFASMRLRGSAPICLIAVQQNGMSLKFASEDIQEDDDVVLAAVRQNGSALQFASKLLQADRSIVETAVSKTGQ